jgi:hypothetical protein
MPTAYSQTASPKSIVVSLLRASSAATCSTAVLYGRSAGDAKVKQDSRRRCGGYYQTDRYLLVTTFIGTSGIYIQIHISDPE